MRCGPTFVVRQTTLFCTRKIKRITESLRATGAFPQIVVRTVAEVMHMWAEEQSGVRNQPIWMPVPRVELWALGPYLVCSARTLARLTLAAAANEPVARLQLQIQTGS